MMRKNWLAFCALSAALSVFGCNDDGGASETGGTGGGGTGATGGAPSGSGSATLTIGDEVWEFDSFGCAFGYDATQSAVFSFSSSAIGDDSEGVRLQLTADIMDDSGQERYEGAGVIYIVDIDDIENFDDPTVAWEAMGPAEDIVVTIDGNNVTAQGVFDNRLTDSIEEVPGTLEAVCGAQSIR